MEKEAIKAMIELAKTIKEANGIIEEFTPFKSTSSKIAYLYGMFDVAVIGAHGQDNVEADYQSVLSTIVNKKWR